MVKKKGSLKYVLIFAAAVILIRIDVVIELGQKVVSLFQSEAPELRPEDLGEPPVIVRSEKNVSLTPRQQYLAFMENFRVSPELAFRQEAMDLFRKHPQMFAATLDKNLEARLYAWRDLIVQNEAELPLFLLDLASILKGENREMLDRFFSVVLDLNFDMFITSYPRTRDTSCAPVTLLEAAVPPEERLPELYERKGILEEYLARPNLVPDRKLYAQVCLDVLKLHLVKVTPEPTVETSAEAPENPAPEETSP